jgi:urea carboxylase
VAAPFAAKVGQIEVDEGDTVAAGQRIVVLEAMKMEVSVPADAAGVVTWVRCRPGQLVAAANLWWASPVRGEDRATPGHPSFLPRELGV